MPPGGLLKKAVLPIVGLGAEAIAHHKNKKKEKEKAEEGPAEGGQAQDIQPPSYEQSAHHPHPGGLPPQHSADSKDHPIDSKELPIDAKGEETIEAFDENPPPYEPAADSESDEEDWQADEATPAPPKAGSCVPPGKAGGPASVDDIVKAFLEAYPVQPSGNLLPCPVILPQKRPGTKTRGFVHAYSPALDAMGIDERAWMDFLNCFEESIRVSPIFDAINVAVNIAGFVPEPAVQAATIAITFAEETTKRVYQRGRYNNFLAQLNEKYFRQFGLFALIMTYDPDSTSVNKHFDLSSTIAKAEQDPDATGAKLMWKNVKGVTGKTRGRMQMPQAAELVFPDTEKPEGENWFKRTNKFVGDYFDRRAQAHYAIVNPGSSLSVTPQFESSAGGIGTSSISKREQREQIKNAYQDGDGQGYGYVSKRQLRNARRTGQLPQGMPGRGMRVRRGGYGGPISLLITAASGGKLKGRDAHPIAIVRRTLKPGTMYLMVTQRPTDEQLATARGILEEKK